MVTEGQKLPDAAGKIAARQGAKDGGKVVAFAISFGRDLLMLVFLFLPYFGNIYAERLIAGGHGGLVD